MTPREQKERTWLGLKSNQLESDQLDLTTIVHKVNTHFGRSNLNFRSLFLETALLRLSRYVGAFDGWGLYMIHTGYFLESRSSDTLWKSGIDAKRPSQIIRKPYFVLKLACFWSHVDLPEGNLFGLILLLSKVGWWSYYGVKIHVRHLASSSNCACAPVLNFMPKCIKS